MCFITTYDVDRISPSVATRNVRLFDASIFSIPDKFGHQACSWAFTLLRNIYKQGLFSIELSSTVFARKSFIYLLVGLSEVLFGM